MEEITTKLKDLFKNLEHESNAPEIKKRILEFLARLSYEDHLIFDSNIYKITEKEITNLVQYHVREKLEKKVEEEMIIRFVMIFNEQYKLGFKHGKGE